ncbi:MAG TPA: metallophosphoesterase [Myxococcota bacterium]|nr:metallophosphoesterase [Myxococcota bacterium]
MENYDQVFVISDLHMAAAPGLFRSGEQLERRLKEIAVLPGSVVLVINGDFVDFLVGRVPGDYYNVAGALATLEALSHRWSQLFSTLRVVAESKKLVITIGNHDLELMSSKVRKRLEGLIGPIQWGMWREGSPAEDRGRFECWVGGRRVKCIHGNGEDTWNVYHLPRVEAELLEGSAAPCAGTRLVVDILNEAKAVDPFLEVLKPEDSSLLLIALARQKALYAKVPLLVGAVVQQGTTMRRFLSGLSTTQLAPTAETLLAELAAGEVQPEGVEEGERLGLGGLLLDSLLGRNPSENLYEAMRDWLERKGQDIYDLQGPDPTMEARKDNAGADILVAGHTHLARCLRNGPGIFLNAGTWTNLMRIPSIKLRSALAFAEVAEAMDRARGTPDRPGSLDPLSPYLFDPRNCVHIRVVEGMVRAELQETRADGSVQVVAAEVVPARMEQNHA